MDAVKVYDDLIAEGAEPTYLESGLYAELARVEMENKKEVEQYVDGLSTLLDKAVEMQDALRDANALVSSLSRESWATRDVADLLGRTLENVSVILEQVASDSSTVKGADIEDTRLEVLDALDKFETLA